MPLSVFKAMMDSKTPGEFLDLVLKAVKNNRWDYASPTDAEVERFKARLKDARLFESITFQAKESKKCVPFVVDRREAQDLEEILERGKKLFRPRIVLFKDLHVPLEESAGGKASEIVGFKQQEHPTEEDKAGSISYALKLPSFVVEHWAASGRPGQPEIGAGEKQGKSIRFSFDDEKFEELNRYNSAASVVTSYLTTLKFLRNRYSDNHYLKLVGLDEWTGPQGLTPLQTFLCAHEKYADFFQAVADAADMRGDSKRKRGWLEKLKRVQARRVEDAMLKTFEVAKCPYTEYLTGKIVSSFEHRNIRDKVMDLAEKAKIGYKFL